MVDWSVDDPLRMSEHMLRMDPTVELETRRLLISATLTAQVRRCLGRSLAADSSARELLDLAPRLNEEVRPIERAYRLRFEPPYPGVTAGPQSTGGTSRLLLACRARDRDGTPIGVVFTALIAGRPPQVSVAPTEAGIPRNWRPPADFH
jgi:hypothetical protein